ncbi:MAG: TrkH family potassium uptake protein [Rhodobacteraceae bacterium]|nr:TrkH family potassium uptake protein [Paracoccaceae bacterium]
MPARLLNLPLIVILMGIGAAAMYLPTAYAVIDRDWQTARAFFYSGSIFLILVTMLGIATANYAPRRQARDHLMALLAAFAVLPLMLAVPLRESVGNTSFLNAYFEMVSSLTTTGATVFEDPARLGGADHLWRALVGWMGGFLIWVAAIAILAPLNLGGFEVMGPPGDDTGAGADRITGVADAPMRVQRYAASLIPVYGGVTLVLWVALMVAGDGTLVALCHAMSTLATSGISPTGGISGGGSGLIGEAMVFAFFGFALSRRTFARDTGDRRARRGLVDPEIQMGLYLTVGVAVLLFLRHWVGAFEVESAQSLKDGLLALWGGVFTVLSFLSTTGFESTAWESARGWSGLETPGLILLGLAMIGGGVATTAGGVKLMRVFVLYRHAQRELERLVHPNSVGGSGSRARYLRRQGAYVAWIFFMLFAVAIAATMLALSLTGLTFEPAVVLTVAALSTTGPLAGVAGEVPLSYATLPGAAKLILSVTMVLGRLETLAIVALLNPGFWRG